MNLEIEVEHPTNLWFAKRGDLPWLTDPADNRYQDAESINWTGIGRAVQVIGQQLRSRKHNPADETVTVTTDLGALNELEQEIVSWWFKLDLGISSDIHHDALEDGRHRLWNVWSADKDLELPIYSQVLRSKQNIGVLRDRGESKAAQNLHEVMMLSCREALDDFDNEFLQRNRPYYRELIRWGKVSIIERFTLRRERAQWSD
ncbi:hypothetical protein [Glutamicibacter soli]